MTSLTSIASNFIEPYDVCVDIVIDGKKSFKLTNITECIPRKICDPAAQRGKRKKKLWAKHFVKSDYSSYPIRSVTELCVQQYLDNGKFSEKMHTTYDMLEFVWKNLDAEVHFDVDGIKYQAKEKTLRALSNKKRSVLISEEMVVKEPSNKRRRVSPKKKSTSLVTNHIESFLYGDNYLTIVTKTGEPLVRVYPAWKEQIITQTTPASVTTHAEYKVRISQYSATERSWSPKSKPQNASVLHYLEVIGDKGLWRILEGGKTVFFSNYFDVKLGDWLIPVSATAVTSDNIDYDYSEQIAFRRKLFQSTRDICSKLLSNMLYPEIRIVRCSDIVLKDGYTPLK